MNKDKVEKLNKALLNKESAASCNDLELAALLKAGEQIKNSTFNNSASTLDFKERLQADLRARRQTKSFSMTNKISLIWKNFRARLAVHQLVPALALMVLIAVIATTFWRSGDGFSPLLIEAAYAHDNFTVEPTAGGDLGVEADTQFIIKSKTAIKDLDNLRSNIKLSPDTTFELKELSEYEFQLIPNNKLADKRVYRLAINSSYVNENNLTVDHKYSWAFQVKDKFKIVGSIPADRTSAPTNTGIEITFSTENFSGLEQAFSISPEVAGRFEKHKRTMVFIPAQPLATSTLYTVTVTPTVSDISTGEKLSEPYRFQFEAEDNNASLASVNFTDDLVEFTTKQNPAFGVFVNKKQADQKITTKIYNYRSLDTFTSALKKYYEIPNWARSARRQAAFDYSSLSLTASYELPLVNNDRGDYLVLPNNLPAGFYLIEVSLGNNQARIFVQVTNISAYTSVTNNKILFWVNDLETNKLAAAKVTNLDNKIVTAVDASGVATVEASGNATTTNTLFSVESEGKLLVVSVPPSYNYSENNPKNSYWSYLYTDRNLYQPTDTISFWGFAKSRNNDNSTFNQELTVRLINDNSFNYYLEPMIVVEQKIKTDDKGFFIGGLKFNNLSPSNYRLEVDLNGRNLYSGRYLTIENYIKPAYQIKVTPSATAVFAGSKINYQVQANFFEGTALANNELAINHELQNDSSDNSTTVTDINGLANLSYVTKCVCQEAVCSDYCYDYLTATPNLAEKAEISGSNNVVVFRTYQHFGKTSITQVAGQNKALIKTQVFNTDLNNNEDNWNGGPVANKKIIAKITRIEYVPRQTGTYYDFINKLTYPVYTYDTKKTVLPDLSFVTVTDGSGTADFEVNPKYSYEIVLVASDQYENKTYVSSYFSATSADIDPRYEYYNITSVVDNNSGYNFNDLVKLTVKRNNQEVVKDSGRFLFFRLQNGLRDYSVLANPDYNFVYTNNDLPNVYVAGAWFDGKTYYEFGSFNVYFKREVRQLEVDVKAGADKYKPGEEATLNITVKDSAGHGVKTHVNLSAVDAAMASLGGIAEPTPLLDLYESMDSGWLGSQYSHRNRLFGGGAEKGGGGDGGRSFFPDLALFLQTETDNSGQATVKFKLPDNITSWQISTQAISNNLEAGATTTQLKATLPFFVEVNSTKQYLAGDEPTIKATTYGEALNVSNQVQTYIESAALGLSSKQNLSAFAPAYFNLGKLSAGQYEFKVGASYNNNQDAVISQAAVINSLLSERHQIITDLKVGAKISGSDKNWTTVTLMDNNRGRYYSQLLNLSYSDGARVDQKLSSVVATDLMKDYFGDKNDNEIINPDLKIYQTSNGGISLLPYSTADLKISVLVAMSKPDAFDRTALASYFYDIYNNPDTNREEMALALSGLAALNEPVLIPLREFSNIVNLAPLDKLHLALGAYLIGDNELAQKIYNELIANYGEQLDPYLRLKIDDKDNENNSIATALAAVLAAGLGDSRAESFWHYAGDNRPNDYLTNLEQLLYLRAIIPTIPAGDSKFTIKIDSREITKDLSRGDNYSFTVSPEQLATLEVTMVSGNISAISNYDGAADLKKQNKSVIIDKSYWNNGQELNSFKESDIVEIRLKPQFNKTAIDGTYEITDILPSGLKLLTNIYNKSVSANCGTWYPYGQQGQKIQFIISQNWDAGCNRGYISYFARVSQPGKYVVEPALIQSTKAADVKSYSTVNGQLIISQ